MFSTKSALFGALVLAAVAVHAQEKHLTLDDIDSLARQKIVDSMRRTDGAAAAPSGVGLNAPLAPPGAAVAAVPDEKKGARKPAAPAKRVTPVSFVGAYSDASGSYVLYDFQGSTYTARQGSKLLNGWTISGVNGFVVALSDGKRKWTETIATPDSLAAPDSPGVQAITDLGGPLPPGGFAATAPTYVPFGK